MFGGKTTILPIGLRRQEGVVSLSLLMSMPGRAQSAPRLSNGNPLASLPFYRGSRRRPIVRFLARITLILKHDNGDLEASRIAARSLSSLHVSTFLAILSAVTLEPRTSLREPDVCYVDSSSGQERTRQQRSIGIRPGFCGSPMSAIIMRGRWTLCSEYPGDDGSERRGSQ